MCVLTGCKLPLGTMSRSPTGSASTLTAAPTLWLPCAAAATCRAGHELDARRQAVQDPRRQVPDECSEDDACASAFRADLGIG
jgi:hypothetical protein